jgi:flagellar basal-body rod protein FlgG
MLEGLYSAAAGMAAQQQRMDAVANDLANVNTNGYKRVRVAFRDLLYVRDASGRVQSGAGAAATTIGRGLAQGPIRETGNPLDLAIEDGGFLRVRRADGTQALTRDGALRLDPRGRLTTQRGDLLQPAMTVPAGTNESDVEIASDGTVTANGRALGRIALVTVRSPEAMQSLGDGMFVPTAASGPATALATGRVRQGAVEAANVDVADAMTDMMDAQRSFQLASRAVQMQDQLLRIANEVKS